MGLADVLLGRKKLKGAAGDRLFALSTAGVTLEWVLRVLRRFEAGMITRSFVLEIDEPDAGSPGVNAQMPVTITLNEFIV